MSKGMTPVLMIRFGWGMFDDIETGDYNDHHDDREIMLMMMMITWGRCPTPSCFHLAPLHQLSLCWFEKFHFYFHLQWSSSSSSSTISLNPWITMFLYVVQCFPMQALFPPSVWKHFPGKHRAPNIFMYRIHGGKISQIFWRKARKCHCISWC